MMTEPSDSFKQNLHHRSFNPTDAGSDGPMASVKKQLSLNESSTATASATADVVTIQPDIQQSAGPAPAPDAPSAGPPDAAFRNIENEKTAFRNIPDASQTDSTDGATATECFRKQDDVSDIGSDNWSDNCTQKALRKKSAIDQTVKATLEMAKDGKPIRRIIFMLAAGLRKTDIGDGPAQHAQSIFRYFYDQLNGQLDYELDEYLDIADAFETFERYWTEIEKPIQLVSASDFWAMLQHGIATPSATAKHLADVHFIGSNCMARLIECCILAQQTIGDGYFLPGRKCGELFGVTQITFSRWLRRLIDTGLVEIIEPGNAGRSPRLRWTGPTGTGPEPVPAEPTQAAAPASSPRVGRNRPSRRPTAKPKATKTTGRRTAKPRTDQRQPPAWFTDASVIAVYIRKFKSMIPDWNQLDEIDRLWRLHELNQMDGLR